MKLIGLMLARGEKWVVQASADAASRWCDGLVLINHGADLATASAFKHGTCLRVPFVVQDVELSSAWQEMDMREQSLLLGRKMGGTHFAIIDADEVLTANYLPHVRQWFTGLAPMQCLDVPMVPVWDDPLHWRDGDKIWSYSMLTLGFRDAKNLCWRAAGDGYQHHNRPPYGAIANRCTPLDRYTEHGNGGVMHLQWANQRRLLAKHVLYRMVDHLRWPGRRTIDELNTIYDWSLKPSGSLVEVPAEWWGTYRKDTIDVTDVPWQEAEIHRLLRAHGRKAFEGLDLKGLDAGVQ